MLFVSILSYLSYISKMLMGVYNVSVYFMKNSRWKKKKLK